MDLFEYENQKRIKKDSPLANRLRPSDFENFIGQEHILNKNSILYKAIKADKLTSLILYGPAGVGKTTLANIIANITKSNFEEINATVSGIKDIKNIADKAKENVLYAKKTILFIDEIHRFNKTQQDFLLPYVENGTLILIGATTENPYFEINKALISRSIIFKLNPLSKEDIKKIMLNAISNKEKGLGHLNITITEDALEFISNMAEGDARIALNAIELAALTTEPLSNNQINIDLNVAQGCIQKKIIKYDKNSDNHYDVISAFIKSMRGSDPNAAIHYLAKMLCAGEDPKFIARRIVICASEDIGNADPNALQVAVAAFKAVEFIGMPEAQIILSQAVAYISSAPKSNSAYLAIKRAVEDIENIEISPVPSHLKDAHYKYSKNLGNGIGYKYPHSYTGSYVKQQYLPDSIKEKVYYEPTQNGYEKNIKAYLNSLK